MVGTLTIDGVETASVTVMSNNGMIEITLTNTEDMYYYYNDIDILVYYQSVSNMEEIGFWNIGEKISIGSDESYGFAVNGDPIEGNPTHNVRVVIQGTVVYESDVTIS